MDTWQRRLGLSMALVRFVNGLVDPLQVGRFAKSIWGLAGELGIPGWLVEVRHRGTHEELPGLEVLLEGARQAMDWLYTNYWLPTLSSLSQSPTSNSSLSTSTQASLTPLLKTYKNLVKQSLQDATSVDDEDIASAMLQIEAWAESTGREGLQGDQEEDEWEERGVEELCARLCEVQVLVPLSSKKRPATASTPLSVTLLSLYEPLLTHLHLAFPHSLLPTLLNRLLSLLKTAPSEPPQQPDKTEREEARYWNCLVGWAGWVLVHPGVGEEEKEEAVKELFLNPNHYTLATLTNLRTSHPHLLPPTKADPLLHLLRNGSLGLASTDPLPSVEQKVAEMAARWASFVEKHEPRKAVEDVEMVENQEDAEGRKAGGGWELVPEGKWKACPIGMLPGGVLPDFSGLVTVST